MYIYSQWNNVNVSVLNDWFCITEINPKILYVSFTCMMPHTLP